MFAMKKRRKVGLGWKAYNAMMTGDVQGSIYTMLLFCFQKRKTVGCFCCQDEIHKRIASFVIMHPMVTRDQIYRKSDGHTVLTHCWRIRIATGLCDFVPQTLGLCVLVEDE